MGLAAGMGLAMEKLGAMGLGSRKKQAITVQGPIAAGSMGRTLIHEHVLVDFIGAAETGFHRWDKEEVINKMAPYLLEVKELGFQTIVDCTPMFLGRDPVLLKKLSEKTGIHILTNTGIYGAVDNKFVPDYAKTESARQLADRWIEESRDGIEGTGVRPGFIKISVAPGPLSELHKKLVTAAGQTHLETGLAIASHTGPAVPALEQLKLLKSLGVEGNAFIWVHAQNEKDNDNFKRAADLGGWISIEGIRKGNVEERANTIFWLKEAGLLDQTLVSHDAGWYDPDQPGGGEITGFTLISEKVVPLLTEKGFSEKDIEKLLVKNPAKAFQI